MKVHVLRLLPKQDLLKALLAYIKDQAIEAAVVISCVGSTGSTVLRPAGVPKPKVFKGSYEITSLTGTLGLRGHHLHLGISDAECKAYGGHLLEGTLVRTTAEIALGVVEGVRFTRPQDLRTGYDELSIDQLQ